MTHEQEIAQIIKKAINESNYALRKGLSVGEINADLVQGASVVLQIDQRRMNQNLPTTMVVIQ